MQASSSSGRAERADRYDRPRFRQDLFAELIDEQGARFIDVMDPDSGSLFRFYEVEYSLACAMDGERDVSGIVKWAQEELGLTPSQQEVRSVIATLGDLGFIDTGAETAAAAEPPATELIADEPDELTPVPSFELARNVVVGAPGRSAPTTDLELGAAGTAPPLREPMRPAPDLALGVPGRPAGRTTDKPTPSHGTPTGDVSLDLADHVAVRPDDVKEAVRASRVMPAVEPRDYEADKATVRPKAPGPAPAGRPEPPAPRLPEPAHPPEPARAIDARSAEVSRASDILRVPESAKPAEPSRPARPPVELTKPPAAFPGEGTSTISSESSRSGLSAALIILFVVVLLAAAAILVWKYVLESRDTTGDTSALPAPPVKPAPPPVVAPPPPPPPPTSRIVLETPAPEALTLVKAGVIQNILADKTLVKQGDIVVRLVGDRPIQAELSALTNDQKKLQDAVSAATRKRDAAQAAGWKAAETAATTELATKQNQLAAKQAQFAAKTADLDKFLIRAPADGTFSPQVKQGSKVAANGAVGKLQRTALATASFRLADTKLFAASAPVDLALNPEQHISCTVAEVQPDGIKVTCPADAFLVDDTDVTLKLPEGAHAGGHDDGAPAGHAPAPAEAAGSAAAESAAGSAAAPTAGGSAAAPVAVPVEPPSAGSAR